MSKFKVGDKVRIVKYGHIILELNPTEDYLRGLKVLGKNKDRYTVIDMAPEYIGIETIVTEISRSGMYSTRAMAWINEEQLELIPS